MVVRSVVVVELPTGLTRIDAVEVLGLLRVPLLDRFGSGCMVSVVVGAQADAVLAVLRPVA